MVKKLLFATLIGGIIALAMKKTRMDRETWTDLTEDEARDRLKQRLPAKIPDEKRERIVDTVVTKMRDRGVLMDDEIDVTTPEGAMDLTDAADVAEVTADA